MEQIDKTTLWGRLFVAGLIVAGIGLTGSSMITRVEAIENYPRVVYNVLQQSCDTRSTPYSLQKADGGIPTMTDRPC